VRYYLVIFFVQILILFLISGTAFADSSCKNLFSSNKEKIVLGYETVYEGKGAEAFYDVTRSSGHGPSSFELKIFSNGFLSYLLKLKDSAGNGIELGSPFQMVELGPGTGEKAVFALKDLQAKGAMPEKYVLMDYSESMLDLAHASIAKEFPLLDLTTKQGDLNCYNCLDLSLKKDIPTVYMMLGQTLGNFRNKIEILDGILNTLKPEDQLIIGVSSVPSVESGIKKSLLQALKNYQEPKVLEFMLSNLKEMGLNESNGSYELKIDMEEKAIVAVFTTSREVAHKGKIIKKGAEIEFFYSKRFTLLEPMHLIEPTKFKVAFTFYHSDHDQMIYVLKRRFEGESFTNIGLKDLSDGF
jgi:hypothetical protein